MTSKQRMVAAIRGEKPDRLPVTTHHVMGFFLKKYMGGADAQRFFDHFGLDPILWTWPWKPYGGGAWRLEKEEIARREYRTVRHRIVTPKGALTAVVESNEYTGWATERFLKEKGDIGLLGEFLPAPECDMEEVNRQAAAYGERGLVRGHICCFDVTGQPGCWQDAACLYGVERLILETYEDSKWVHELLEILFRRKAAYVRSLKGAKYDLLELGGGDASSTVISPRLFDEFVAPYDGRLIALAHEAGQRIVYHTCGGMMPMLEHIAAMKPDAMETFTPPGMGGDTRLREARERLGGGMCMIGGFDQFHFFTGCTESETRAEVRRCFDEAGRDGAFILSPSDHFFDADPALIAAYADEARKCS